MSASIRVGERSAPAFDKKLDLYTWWTCYNAVPTYVSVRIQTEIKAEWVPLAITPRQLPQLLASMMPSNGAVPRSLPVTPEKERLAELNWASQLSTWSTITVIIWKWLPLVLVYKLHGTLVGVLDSAFILDTNWYIICQYWCFIFSNMSIMCRNPILIKINVWVLATPTLT